jgi:hypothetical protein
MGPDWRSAAKAVGFAGVAVRPSNCDNLAGVVGRRRRRRRRMMRGGGGWKVAATHVASHSQRRDSLA